MRHTDNPIGEAGFQAFGHALLWRPLASSLSTSPSDPSCSASILLPFNRDSPGLDGVSGMESEIFSVCARQLGGTLEACAVQGGDNDRTAHGPVTLADLLHRARRVYTLAFLMAMHPRLGAQSPAHILDDGVVYTLAEAWL